MSTRLNWLHTIVTRIVFQHPNADSGQQSNLFYEAVERAAQNDSVAAQDRLTRWAREGARREFRRISISLNPRLRARRATSQSQVVLIKPGVYARPLFNKQGQLKALQQLWIGLFTPMELQELHRRLLSAVSDMQESWAVIGCVLEKVKEYPDWRTTSLTVEQVLVELGTSLHEMDIAI